MNMIKLVMILFLLAVMGCGQQEELLSEERSKIIPRGDRGDSNVEEDADVDPTEIFEVSYYYDNWPMIKISRYGIYIGNNKIEEELSMSLDEIPDVKVKLTLNKYHIYNVAYNKYYYTFNYGNDTSGIIQNPNNSNSIDGNSFMYNPINGSLPNIPKGTWVATISLVEQGGDKDKPLQIYDIYR